MVDVVVFLERIRPRRWSQDATGGGSSMCAHLWNWLVRNTAKQSRRKNAAKRNPALVVSMGTNSQASSMKGRLARLLLPLVSMKSWVVMPLGST